MSETDSKIVYRKDYKPFPYSVDSVDLAFVLDAESTLVTTTMRVRPKSGFSPSSLHLDADELAFERLFINGVEVDYPLHPHKFCVNCSRRYSAGVYYDHQSLQSGAKYGPIRDLHEPRGLYESVRIPRLSSHHLLARPPRCDESLYGDDSRR